MINRTLSTLIPHTYLTLFTCSLLLTSFIHSHENDTIINPTTSSAHAETTYSTVDSTLQTLVTGVTSRKGIDARRWLTTQLTQQLNILTLKEFTKLVFCLLCTDQLPNNSKLVVAIRGLNATDDCKETDIRSVFSNCIIPCTQPQKDPADIHLIATQVADQMWSDYKTLREKNGRTVGVIIQELFDKYKKMLPEKLFKEAESNILPDIADSVAEKIWDEQAALCKQHDDSQIGTGATIIKDLFAKYQEILPGQLFKEVLWSMNASLLIGLADAVRAEDKDTITALLTHVFDAQLLKRETTEEDPQDFKTQFSTLSYMPIMRQCLGKHINYVDHKTKHSLLDIVTKQVRKENGKYPETVKYFTYTAPHPGHLQEVQDIDVKRQTAIPGLKKLGAKTYTELHPKK